MDNLREKLRPWKSSVSVQQPTAEDEACTRALEKHLDEVAPLETQEHTEAVLVNLKKMVADWVKWVSINKAGIPEEDAKPGMLFLSGSYRLGVAQKGSDTDTVLCVPMHVTREDFFSEEEHSILYKLRNHPDVSHVLPISTANVPLVEVVWSGIELDVLFAALAQPEVPIHPDKLLDDSLLLPLDNASILSLNGPRVTELIVKLVPKYQTFVLVLRTLRLWAKKRGIYSNKLGFLGGVNFAILAAFACQLWPNETASRCVARLLYLVCHWEWPKPIRLCHPYDVEGASSNEFLRAWDPKGHGMRDRMPIITPAFPNFNSSANVTASTLKVMLREFERGRAEIKEVLSKEAACEPDDWNQFFQPTDFFLRFNTYVTIVARANSEEDLKSWSGFVESRLRKFVELLELQRLPFYEIFPFQSSFDISSQERGEGDERPGKRWFVGLRVDTYLARARYLNTTQINLEGAVVTFSNQVLSRDRLEGTTLDITLLKFKDLVQLFPYLYPDGEREAFRKHAELSMQVEKKMEKERAKSGGAISQDGEPTSLQNESTTEPNVDAGETVSLKRIRGNYLDLTELEEIPNRMVSRPNQQVDGDSGSGSGSFRPSPLKVLLLE